MIKRSIYFKLNFLVILCILPMLSFATNIIGATSLVFPGDHYTYSYESGVESPAASMAVNNQIIQKSQKELNNLTAKLIQKNTDTSLIKFNNADFQLNQIKNKNSRFLQNLRFEDITPTVTQKAVAKTESYVKIISIKPKRSVLLIGYIKKISSSEVKHKIMDSNDISFIYSLDIVIDYKLFDLNTMKPFAEFTAIGHGGIAKIVPNNKVKIQLKPDELVYEAIDSLTDDIRHQIKLKNIADK
jgi:hypothetical protein